MKLLRVGEPGHERPAMLDAAGGLRDLSGVIGDLAGAALDPDRLAVLAALDPAALPAFDVGLRIGPCIGRVGKFLCVGLNYADHAAEAGAALPVEPIVFDKATSAVAGPHYELPLPRRSVKTDWGMKPPTFLKIGDTMGLGIAGLGEQRQRVVASR